MRKARDWVRTKSMVNQRNGDTFTIKVTKSDGRTMVYRDNTMCSKLEAHRRAANQMMIIDPIQQTVYLKEVTGYLFINH